MKMQALENSREMFLQMTLVYVVDVLLLQTGNQVLEDHLLTPSDKKTSQQPVHCTGMNI